MKKRTPSTIDIDRVKEFLKRKSRSKKANEHSLIYDKLLSSDIPLCASEICDKLAQVLRHPGSISTRIKEMILAGVIVVAHKAKAPYSKTSVCFYDVNVEPPAVLEWKDPISFWGIWPKTLSYEKPPPIMHEAKEFTKKQILEKYPLSEFNNRRLSFSN